MTGLERHPRVAVVGSGVAGLVAAYACTRGGARVTLFEADERLGGHADTHVVREGARELHIDTGFIVHNRRTYPTLLRLFEELGIETQRSEMSMSIADESSGVEWAGARGVRGIFPSWRRLADRDHLRMLGEIPRFHRSARKLLAAGENDRTLAEFLAAGGFSAHFVRHFMEPLVAAVWSCEPSLAGEYPARYLFAFLAHHGMLSVTGSPTWRTVTGGSHTYVQRVARLLEEVRLGAAVVAVEEEDEHVVVRDATGRSDTFDAVVIATHPHQALAMLTAATPEQKEVLGAITYVPNTAILHTDTTLLPHHRAAHGSWNFRRRVDRSGGVTVTYDLTRLQRLDTSTRYLVTLGAEDLIDPSAVIARMSYEHPLYTPTSVAAQRRLLDIETGRIAFAGAYHGWGFHEDGARSGAEAARRLGFAWDTPAAPEPWSRQVFATTVTHVRRRPWLRTFAHRSSTWVTEVGHGRPRRRVRDHLLGSIEARDHLGDPAATLRENLATFLAGHDIDLPADARVRLAAHPRALGFCFNPISVFWCTTADGAPIATVVEVHNTYGDRHAYLLRPGEGSHVAKEMYVSPFHDVGGHYVVHAPEPTDDLHVSVALHTPDGAVFSAALSGRVTHGHGLAAALAAAVDGLRDALRIRRHGIALWLRRLPIQPRPDHHQEGVR